MREKEDLTLLGNQNTKYPQDYSPEVLETFENKNQDNDYFVKFNCPELQVFVQLPDSLTLQPYIYPMFRM